MRFWVYEAASRAARGPYEVAQLKELPGFGPDTIVAPENAQAADAWRPASVFTSIQPIFQKHPSASVATKAMPAASGPQPHAAAPVPAAKVQALRSPRPAAPKKPEPQPVVQPAPPAGRSWLKPAALAAGAFLVVSVGLCLRPSFRAHAKSPSGLPSASWQGREQEAISFVKSFPVRDPFMARCPSRIEDVSEGVGRTDQEVPDWPQVKTVQDAYDCARFVPLLLVAEGLASDMNKRPETFALMMRSTPEMFQPYETKLTFSWTAKDQGAGRYRIDAKVGMEGLAVKKMGGATESRDAWSVDLPNKSLQPLLASTWFKFDSKAYTAWAAEEAKRDPHGSAASTEPSVWGEIDVSGVAPSYSLNGSEGAVASTGSRASPGL